jgi:signal transduction histidine kinase
VGIKEEDIPYIFDRFRQSGEHSGSGLGLAIVQNLVALHGGMVEVKSAPGQGSAFTVYLPLDPPAAKDGNEL